MAIEPKSINELNADLFQPEEVDRFGDPIEARMKAMDFLGRREYGFEELIAKLTGRGFRSEIAADAVLKLRAENLQSDQRFADSFMQSRINKGKGPLRIRQELKERGLHRDIVNNVLEQSDADWFELATEIRARKFGPDLPREFKEKARQMRFLQYRGFDQEHINAAMRS